jgi:dihydrofolate reductase
VDVIIDALRLEGIISQLKGYKVIITAGPTREAIDPVRYISNCSSGKMGYALAIAAERAGAEVILISGPTALIEPEGMKVIQVVAMSSNRVIGDHHRLLWHLPLDMRRFKDLTMGHMVLMGRKTYESLPPRFQPLPGRRNVVLSHLRGSWPESVKHVSSIPDALHWALGQGRHELWVIGGSSVYQQTLGLTQTIYLTKVQADLDGDAKYPELTPATWDEECIERYPADRQHAFPLSFWVLQRKQGLDPLTAL